MKIDDLLTFKVLTADIFKVHVFDLSGAEVVAMCKKHDGALSLIWDV